MYILSSSGPLIDKKLYLYSVATAFANNVFPVPGGPYNNIPRNKIQNNYISIKNQTHFYIYIVLNPFVYIYIFFFTYKITEIIQILM